MSTWWGDSKNMEEILMVTFWGQTKAGQKCATRWAVYFAGNSKSHRENSISFIFFESPHQVDMKNVVKSSKHFFGYFKTLKTHSAIALWTSWLRLVSYKSVNWFWLILLFSYLQMDTFCQNRRNGLMSGILKGEQKCRRACVNPRPWDRTINNSVTLSP